LLSLTLVEENNLVLRVDKSLHKLRVGQNRVYTPYMTVRMYISLLILLPYVHRMYIFLLIRWISPADTTVCTPHIRMYGSG